MTRQLKGILFVNLGSPESPSPKDVKPYLAEFLMDERVIDIPYWKRLLLVKGIILNVRPKKSARAYQKIWWEEGSPLVVISQRFVAKITSHLSHPVALAMRYGKMSIEKGIAELHAQGVTQLTLVPLYPHYAMSSYETVVTKVEEVIADQFGHIDLNVIPPFYSNPTYIEALTKRIQEFYSPEQFDHLLFSYHGIPERHIKKSDPTRSHCKIDGSCCKRNSVAHHTCYRHQCLETTRLVAEALGLTPEDYSYSFQSRLLKDPWLKPYTDFVLEELPEKNIKRLAVVTPAFMADCLETLEEIAMEGKDDFLSAGGEKFTHVPCLNDSDEAVSGMAEIVNNWINKF